MVNGMADLVHLPINPLFPRRPVIGGVFEKELPQPSLEVFQI
jgi:hypothetical protein